MEIVKAITQYLDTLLPDRDESVISISSLGYCARQLAYRHHKYASLPLSARSKSVFEAGRLYHDMVRRWIREATSRSGVRLRGFPKEIRVFVGPPTLTPGVHGHVDGILESLTDTKLLEIKSMNTWAWKAFQKGEEIDRAYEIQMTAYLLGAGLTTAVFLAINKDTQEMCQREVRLTPLLKQLCEDRLRVVGKIRASVEPGVIEREHAPDTKGRLPWQCGYCRYAQHCWPEAERVEEHKLEITR